MRYFDYNDETLRELVIGMVDYQRSLYRDVVALYYSENRTALLKCNIFRPDNHSIIHTRINGKHVPRPPKPRPILNIYGGEASNPQLQQLELLQKVKVLHNPYAPLKYVLKRFSEEIDFDGESKSEVPGLEQILKLLIAEDRIVVHIQNLTVSQLIQRPHYKYCMLLLLREVKDRLF